MVPSCPEAPPVQTPDSITARELQQRLSDGEAIQLVDVREDQELELARLPLDVIHLPLSCSSAMVRAIYASWRNIPCAPIRPLRCLMA